MDSIIKIAPLIAAVVGIIALVVSIRNSKGSIIKRIERKERKIQELEFQFAKRYGLNANMRSNYEFYKKRERLEESIKELRKRI